MGKRLWQSAGVIVSGWYQLLGVLFHYFTDVVKEEMFVTVSWSYGKLCISIARSSFLLFIHFVLKDWIFLSGRIR